MVDSVPGYTIPLDCRLPQDNNPDCKTQDACLCSNNKCIPKAQAQATQPQSSPAPQAVCSPGDCNATHFCDNNRNWVKGKCNTGVGGVWCENNKCRACRKGNYICKYHTDSTGVVYILNSDLILNPEYIFKDLYQ